jgi:hypothetical protein
MVGKQSGIYKIYVVIFTIYTAFFGFILLSLWFIPLTIDFIKVPLNIRIFAPVIAFCGLDLLVKFFFFSVEILRSGELFVRIRF